MSGESSSSPVAASLPFVMWRSSVQGRICALIENDLKPTTPLRAGGVYAGDPVWLRIRPDDLGKPLSELRILYPDPFIVEVANA